MHCTRFARVAVLVFRPLWGASGFGTNLYRWLPKELFEGLPALLNNCRVLVTSRSSARRRQTLIAPTVQDVVRSHTCRLTQPSTEQRTARRDAFRMLYLRGDVPFGRLRNICTSRSEPPADWVGREPITCNSLPITVWTWFIGLVSSGPRPSNRCGPGFGLCDGREHMLCSHCLHTGQQLSATEQAM